MSLSLIHISPGMREFGMWDNDTGIDRTFADIEELAAQCRFRNCTHTNEPGCAICSALERGELQTDRWQSYQTVSYTHLAEEEALAKKKAALAAKEAELKAATAKKDE